MGDLIRIVGNTNALVLELKGDVQKLNARVEKLEERMTALEERMTAVEERVDGLEQTVNNRFSRLESSLALQRHHQADLEDEMHHLKKLVLHNPV